MPLEKVGRLRGRGMHCLEGSREVSAGFLICEGFAHRSHKRPEDEFRNAQG